MAKKKTKRKTGFNQQKAFRLVRLAALVAPAAFEALGAGSPQEKLSRAIAWYTGFYPTDGSFDWTRLQRGYGPIVAATLATYGIPKLAGMIRGI